MERAVERHGTAFVQVAFGARQPRTLAGLRSTVRSRPHACPGESRGGFRSDYALGRGAGHGGLGDAPGCGDSRPRPTSAVSTSTWPGMPKTCRPIPRPRRPGTRRRLHGHRRDGRDPGLRDAGEPCRPAGSLVPVLLDHARAACPNGLNTQTGAGAARDDNGHGTNVAGIVTGNGTNAPVGIAPSTKVVAVACWRRMGRSRHTAQVITGPPVHPRPPRVRRKGDQHEPGHRCALPRHLQQP